MKLQKGDVREKQIANIHNWKQNDVRNASAINSCDCIDGNGNGYEIKGWRGSWHAEPQRPQQNRPTHENDKIFIDMLLSHKAENLVAIYGDSKGNEYYIILTFIEYVNLFEKHGNRLNFYRIDTDTRTKQLKFRPAFNKRIFALIERELGKKIYKLA